MDRYNLAYIIMVLLGAGTLFSYNAIMTAADYFDDRYPKRNLTYLAPLCIAAFNPPLQALLIRYGNRVSASFKISLSYSLLTILITLIPVFDSSLKADTTFYLTLILILATGAATALICATIFGFSTMYPAHYTQALMAGQGWSGVIISLARVISKASFADTADGYRKSAIMFFALAAVVSFACIFGYFYLINTEFTKYYMRLRESANNAAPTSSRSDRSVGLLDDAITVDIHEASGAGAESLIEKLPDPAESWKGIFGVVYELRFPILNILMVFIMTFLVFPGLLVSTKPYHLNISKGWFTVLNITIFNVFDLFGRSLPTYFMWFDGSNVHIPILARFLLYPIFLLGSLGKIRHYIVTILFNIIFAASNGYLSSLVMMSAPAVVSEEKRAVGGGIMSLFLNFGILTGSILALFIKEVGHLD